MLGQTISLSPKGRQPALDGLRGTACLMVLFCHTGWSLHYPPLVVYGWTGVHLFFVLSGYLIAKPFLKAISIGTPFPNIIDYARRRVLRIYPPFLVSLCVFLALRALSHRKFPGIWNVMMHGLLFFNYIRQIDYFSINGIYWSLAIEVQFYLLLPLLGWIYYRRRKTSVRNAWMLVGSFIVIGITCRVLELSLNPWTYPGNPPVRFRTVFSYLDLFGYGMIAAVLELSPQAKSFFSRQRRMIFTLVGLALYLAANFWALKEASGDWLTSGSQLYLALFPVLLCVGISLVFCSIVLGPRERQLPWTWGPLVWVGEISYSVYLYHLAVLVFAFTYLPLPWLHGWDMRAWTYGLLCTGPVLLISWVMYRLVEKPSLDLAASYHRKRTDQREAA